MPYDVLRIHVLARPNDVFHYLGGVGDFRLTGVPRELDRLNFNTEQIDGELVVSIPALIRAAYQINWLPDSPVSGRFKRIMYHLLRLVICFFLTRVTGPLVSPSKIA